MINPMVFVVGGIVSFYAGMLFMAILANHNPVHTEAYRAGIDQGLIVCKQQPELREAAFQACQFQQQANQLRQQGDGGE